MLCYSCMLFQLQCNLLLFIYYYFYNGGKLRILQHSAVVCLQSNATLQPWIDQQGNVSF